MLQCDFLQLRVSPAGLEPEVEPHDRFPAGALRSLAEGSFDAVVLSLVLSYLPLPHQRGEMVLKARQLLPSPDPPEVHLAAAAAAAAAVTAEAGGGEAAVGGGGACSAVASPPEDVPPVKWRRGQEAARRAGPQGICPGHVRDMSR